MESWSGFIKIGETPIYLKKYVPEHPKAIVHIVHGMAEHSGMYKEFISYLLENNFAVYIQDLRGHGQTAQTDEGLGFLGHDVVWEHMSDDVSEISKLAKSEVQRPLILFGHSMGSFVSRRAVQKEGKIYDGLILSGSGYDPGLVRKLGVVLSSSLAKMMGHQAKSKLLDKLTFGNFNSKFKPAKTNFDWLSRDYEQVKKYVEDPHCGFICSTSFFREMLKGIGVVHLEAEVKKTPSNLPIYIFSGDEDPVGDMGKGVGKVHQLYQKSGVQNVTLKLYPKGRHEMLHEINREEVFQDIGDWIESLPLDFDNVIVS